VRRIEAQIRRLSAAYAAKVNAYGACQMGFSGGPSSSLFCPPPGTLNLPELPPDGQVALQPASNAGTSTAASAGGAAQGNAPAVVLDPQTVAYLAVARLKLAAPTPGIGPSPDLNRWKMAAVGYPLWLWAEGSTDPAPVSDSVYNLYVSLDARISNLEFLMGDGESVTCRGEGTKWTPGVPAGEESPTCGYRYKKPSLPNNSYTVTIRTSWAVDWNINGQTGTIPYVQTASTELPVGELQVLVR